MSDRKGMDKNAGNEPRDPKTGTDQGGSGADEPATTTPDKAQEGRKSDVASKGNNGNKNKRNNNGNNARSGGHDKVERRDDDGKAATHASSKGSGKADTDQAKSTRQAEAQADKQGAEAGKAADKPARTTAQAGQSERGAQSQSKTVQSSTGSSGSTGSGRTDGTPPGGGSDDGDSKSGGKVAAIIAIVALIVAIIALLGAAWIWHHSQLRMANVDHRVNSLKSSVTADVRDAVMPRLGDIRGRIGDVVSANARQQDNVDQLGDRVASLSNEVKQTQLQVAGMAQRLQGNVQRWQLKQIEQLLVTANRRLQLYRAPQQAKTALKLASEAIARQNDPRLFKVRQRIIDEIAALNALPSPDIEGLAMTLSAFIDQVPDLPLASDVPGTYKADNGETTVESATGIEVDAGWQRFLGSVKKALRNMVTIRRHDGTQQALLPPDQAYFLTQNVMLELRSARLSLLEGNSTLYRQSLSAAVHWLNKYFDTQVSSVSAMIQRLQQMHNIRLDWQAPDISASLHGLRQYMRKRSEETRKQLTRAGQTNDQDGTDKSAGSGKADTTDKDSGEGETDAAASRKHASNPTPRSDTTNDADNADKASDQQGGQ